MALPYSRLLTVLMIFCFTCAKAQTVYYPVHSSDLLRSTASDLASLISRSSGVTINIQPYTSLPLKGIILAYDSTISGNQSCRITGNGTDRIQFSAAQDNGLCFGIYQYLDQLGFRFYLPGTIWEKIPYLPNVFRSIDSTVSGKYKYNNWNISGGYNRWIMDNDSQYGWEVYFGKNGHEWAQYQRRNNMNGSYRFTGHRGDIMNTDYLDSLRQNPCYVASYNNSREASVQSVPDINNQGSMALWANTIGARFTSVKNIILGNPSLYVNYFRNFNYSNQHIGIEVPDGAHWGNSLSIIPCTGSTYNGDPYPKPSDQQFMLVAYTTQKLKIENPGRNFQCYAYATHANVPSSSISIPENVDVQVVPTAFQFETSPKALLNRWYSRTSQVSEYHYFNIPQWTGEMPMFSTSQYKITLDRIRSRSSQGIVIEASPAKFATLPFIFAGNSLLQNEVNFDSSIDEFINSMFPQAVGIHIKKLLEYFGDENVFSIGNFTPDNKFKIPLFLQTLNNAVMESGTAGSPEVKARLREIKAYLHYMILYYDLLSDPQSFLNKPQKAAALCLYLARINDLRLVNSFFLIQYILRKYPATHELQSRFNTTDGTAYLNGSLSPLTEAEIDTNFSEDLSGYGGTITGYQFSQPSEIISKLNGGGLRSLGKIKLSISYTNGYEYPNRAEFYFYAPHAGSVDISCAVRSAMPGGFVNISAEGDDDPLDVILDTTLYPSGSSANILIRIQKAGIYKLSFVSKFQTITDVNILTSGNTFFRKGAYYGNKVENYRDDWASLPRYVFVPSAVKKLFFSVNNACSPAGCIGSSEVGNSFMIRNNKDVLIMPEVSASDPSLFSLDIDAGVSGSFLEVNRMNQYNLCFANISNIEVYAERKVVPEDAPVATTSFEVFSNPSNGTFTFRNVNALPFEEIIITNILGNKIAGFSNTSTINIEKFPSGVYLYKARLGNIWHSGKLIKL